MSALRDPGRGQAQPPVGRSSSDELFAYFRLSVGLGNGGLHGLRRQHSRCTPSVQIEGGNF